MKGLLGETEDEVSPALLALAQDLLTPELQAEIEVVKKHVNDMIDQGLLPATAGASGDFAPLDNAIFFFSNNLL